jgi:pimeloyl-ACP methyl ester carboxylesterase
MRNLTEGYRYWDAQYKPEKYSYVNAALKAGYSILYYDRLGTGQSEMPDAYEIVQNGVQVEIVRQLATLARAGKLVPITSNSTWTRLAVPEFQKVVLVGHSMGSVYSAGALAKEGDLFNGAILTGFFPSKEIGVSKNSAHGYVLARTAGGRFHDRPDGYLVQGTSQNDQLVFLNKGYFEPEILDYIQEIKDTDTVGEMVDLPITIATTLLKNPYKGPVLVSCDYLVHDDHHYQKFCLICPALGRRIRLCSLRWQLYRHLHPG